MNGGIDPEPTSSCVWCGRIYELWSVGAENGFCSTCVKLGRIRLSHSLEEGNLTRFGRVFRKLIFKGVE